MTGKNKFANGLCHKISGKAKELFLVRAKNRKIYKPGINFGLKTIYIYPVN